MRRGDALYYLNGDHLSSTSLTTDDTGNIVSEVRYLPYGEACPEPVEGNAGPVAPPQPTSPSPASAMKPALA
jgi:hypothetical protein